MSKEHMNMLEVQRANMRALGVVTHVIIHGIPGNENGAYYTYIKGDPTWQVNYRSQWSAYTPIVEAI